MGRKQHEKLKQGEKKNIRRPISKKTTKKCESDRLKNVKKNLCACPANHSPVKLDCYGGMMNTWVKECSASIKCGGPILNTDSLTQSDSEDTQSSELDYDTNTSYTSEDLTWQQTYKRRSFVRIVGAYDSGSNRLLTPPDKVIYVLNDGKSKTRQEFKFVYSEYRDNFEKEDEFLKKLKQYGVELDDTLDCTNNDNDRENIIIDLLKLMETNLYIRSYSKRFVRWIPNEYKKCTDPVAQDMQNSLRSALACGMMNGSAKTFVVNIIGYIICYSLRSTEIGVLIPDDEVIPVHLINPDSEHLDLIINSKKPIPSLVKKEKKISEHILRKDVKPDVWVCHDVFPGIFLLLVENRIVSNAFYPAFLQSMVQVISTMRFQRVGFGLILNGTTWNVMCIIKTLESKKMRCFFYKSNFEKTVQINGKETVVFDKDSFVRMLNMIYKILAFGNDDQNLL